MVDQVSPKIHPAAVVECEITHSIVLQTVHMAVPERYYTTGSFDRTTTLKDLAAGLNICTDGLNICTTGLLCAS